MMRKPWKRCTTYEHCMYKYNHNIIAHKMLPPSITKRTGYSYRDRRRVSPFKPKYEDRFFPRFVYLLKYTLHKVFCQFISWKNCVNSGKFMDNCWTISCQVMAYMKEVYIDLIIINLYLIPGFRMAKKLKCLRANTSKALLVLKF